MHPADTWTITYLRVPGRRDPAARRCDPLVANHPAVGTLCPGCEAPFAAGDVVGLCPVGPGDSEDDRAKAREGRYYNARAIAVHWACLTGEVTP